MKGVVCEIGIICRGWDIVVGRVWLVHGSGRGCMSLLVGIVGGVVGFVGGVWIVWVVCRHDGEGERSGCIKEAEGSREEGNCLAVEVGV